MSSAARKAGTAPNRAAAAAVAPISHSCLGPKWLVVSKSSELAPRLRDCLGYLRSLEQGGADVRPVGLENVAQQLLDPTLAGTKHAAVRVLAAQAAVELLRIYAPNPPYDAPELKVRNI